MVMKLNKAIETVAVTVQIMDYSAKEGRDYLL